MGEVVQLFPRGNSKQITTYRVEDPGLTWYEEGQIISNIQLKNDATQLQCSVQDILEEMCVTVLQ